VEQTSISGTGASAIYPLLACDIEHTWNFVAASKRHNVMLSKCEDSEIDERSVETCQTKRLSELYRQSESHVQATVISTTAYESNGFRLHYVFYSSAKDDLRSTEFKEFDPNAVRKIVLMHVRKFDQLIQVYSGAEVEMIIPGGETSFVAQISSEGLQLRTRCR
jgi:23S rRNA A1618 N6-methylase RlmF